MKLEHDQSVSYEGISPIKACLRGHCPRCGEGNLYDGYLELAKTCDHCDLDLDFADAADGPAVFIVLVAGFVIVVLSLLVEINYRPAYWVHAVLWLPLGIALPVLMLKPLKGVMIGLQFRNKAKQAMFDKDGLGR